MNIKNCIAIVSGGGSGMGAATARLLSANGAKVAVLDINQTHAEKIAAEIKGLAVTCDVTHAENVIDAIQKINETIGTARICVNCAGIVKSQRMVSKKGPMPLDEFRQVIEVNLVGTFNLMRLAAEAMMKLEPVNDTGERGVIINTASVAAFEGQIGQTAYSASKGGIVAMTLPAAREMASFGIRVMTIAPGLVDTPMAQQLPDEARAALINMLVFPKRLARAEEFAELAAHIVENAMLNGEVIRLDGALRMQPK